VFGAGINGDIQFHWWFLFVFRRQCLNDCCGGIEKKMRWNGILYFCVVYDRACNGNRIVTKAACVY